jgi:hypothetical protein
MLRQRPLSLGDSDDTCRVIAIHGITTYKDVINRSSIRRGYDLALPECAHYCPFLPRVIGHRQNVPFPLAWRAVGVDAESEASDQVAAGH